MVGPGGGGTRLSGAIAERLGQPAGCNTTWHALDRALRIAALQGIQVILALDDRADHTSSLSIDELSTLAHGGFGQEAKLTIIQISRPLSEPSWQGEQGWTLAIGLQRLTRSQVNDYLAAKLAGAGCSERVFTPRAVTRLHGLSGGIPPRTRAAFRYVSPGGLGTRARGHSSRCGQRRLGGMFRDSITGESMGMSLFPP